MWIAIIWRSPVAVTETLTYEKSWQLLRYVLTALLVFQGRSTHGNHVATDLLVSFLQLDLRAEERIAVRDLIRRNLNRGFYSFLPRCDYVGRFMFSLLGEMLV